jgi:hypothetical protein
MEKTKGGNEMSHTIKPNELRIGNVLMYTGFDEGDMRCEVDAIDIMQCDGDNATFNDVHHTIPLTPEILLEMGFVNWDKGAYHKDCIGLRVNEDGDGFVFHIIGDKKVIVRHVHHLQNIFHLLTGEELTLNTK